MFSYRDLSELFGHSITLDNGKTFTLRLFKFHDKTDIIVYDDKTDENGCLCNQVYRGKTSDVKRFLKTQC